MLFHPKAIGAVAPSSPKLSRLMASPLHASSAPVLEIGAGTGAITRAILDRGVSPERLFIVERDPELAAFLRRQFPCVHVNCGDARHCGTLLAHHRIAGFQTIVSSLPLLNFHHAQRMELIETMLRVLTPDGELIQYTYGGRCPIPARRFGLYAECSGRVWQNLPPAAVWRFRKR